VSYDKIDKMEISKCLKEAGFIVLRKELKKPLVKEGEDWNKKIISYEEANQKLSEGFNIGLVAGVKDFIVIDCDGLELSQACEELLPQTYSEQTISVGSSHYILRIKERMKNLGLKIGTKHFGEIRCNRQYIVIAPSRAKDPPKKIFDVRSYKVLNEVDEIPYVTVEQVKEVIKPFVNVEQQRKTKLNQKTLDLINSDPEISKLFNGDTSDYPSRSEAEQSLVNKLIARNFDKETIFKIMAHSKTDRWNEGPFSYRKLTYNNAVAFVTQNKGGWIKDADDLKFWTYRDYEKYKMPKNYLIDGLVYPAEISMLYGQTNSFKSIYMLYKAHCLASGRKFLNKFKTKKCPVAILSAENSKNVDKKRMILIRRGLKIRKKDLELYILPRSECEDILKPTFKTSLYKFIEEHKIKALFLDTINPLTPDIDDNKAKDVTRVFNDILKTLSDRYNCYVSFLHHTDKKGTQFLGSAKWKANCDVVTRIERKELDNNVTIYNEKNRDGETNTLKVTINFFEKFIEVKLIDESKPQIFKKKKKMTQQQFLILKLNQLIEDKNTKRRDIQEIFTKNEINFSSATLDRALKEWRE